MCNMSSLNIIKYLIQFTMMFLKLFIIIIGVYFDVFLIEILVYTLHPVKTPTAYLEVRWFYVHLELRFNELFNYNNRIN